MTLSEYQPKGYARSDAGLPREEILALDAAVCFTASNIGPAVTTENDGSDWWIELYDCACRGVEAAIVDALVERGEPA